MRALLILIKREIVDHIVYFICAVVVSALLVAATVVASADFDTVNEFGLILSSLVGVSLIVVPGLCGLGVAQMYSDRGRNVSAFLLALPVTRFQLFAARVLTGILAVIVLVVPSAVAAMLAMTNFRVDELPVFHGLVGDLFLGIFMAYLACYSVGLYAGWKPRSLAPTLVVLPAVFLIPSLVVIKGFGLELVAVLSVLMIACLAAAWCRFSTTSL